MRGCQYSCEGVPAGPGSSAATGPRAPGPSWIESLARLLYLQVTQDVLVMDIQTYPTISSRAALHKFLKPETRILHLLLPDWLASVPIIELGFLAEVVSILVFVTHPVLDYHVVAI